MFHMPDEGLKGTDLISVKPSQKSLALQEVIASLHAASNIEEVMQHINRGVVQVLGYNGLIVVLLDEDRKAFRWSILHTKKKLKVLANVKAISGVETPAETQYSQFGGTLLDGNLYITHHFRDIAGMSLGKVTTRSAIRKAMGAKTFVSVPLLDKGKVLGCMIVATSKKKVTEEEIEPWVVLAAEATASMQRIELTKARELEESEAKYKQLLEDINDSYLVVQDGKIVFASVRCAELFGYKLEEFLERPFEDFVSPDLRQSLVEWYETRRGGEVTAERYEWEIAKKDGMIVPVEFNAKSIYYQGRLAVCAIITDITERKKAEKKLTEAYQELETTQQELITLQRAASSIQTTQNLDQILQQLADGISQGTSYDASVIFLLDEDKEVFRLATISPMLGVFPFVEEILGYKPTEFTIPANGNYSETMRMILDGQVIRTHDLYEITAPRLNRAACSALQGFIKAKSILAVPMIANGKVVGAFLVTTQQEQISERRIESLVSFANQAASLVENARLLDIEGKEQQRNTLLLAISHEFKVPLTSIKTMGGLLAEELKRDSQSPQAKMVDNIRRSASKMERRLDDLLDFARMRTATAELELQPINVKTAIEEATSLCLSFILSKKQTLEVDVPDYLPPAVLDQLRFERIITNLLTNASKFTPEGGKIRLRAREKNGNLTVEVRDSGLGIPKSELGRIFEPYYRGKASEPSSSGLGLGLSIVKELVKLHQGKVWVESKPGKGSTFTFSLPVRDGKSTELRKGDKEEK